MSIIKKKAQLDCGKIEIGCQSQGGMQTGRLGDVTMNVSPERSYEFIRGFEHVDEEHRVGEKGILPRRATKYSAGYDFYSPVNVVIPAGHDVLIWTNVKAFMQSNEVLLIAIRSSYGTKKKVVLANQLGIVDADYYSNPDNDGNIGICLRNLSDSDVLIERGDRIAQGFFTNYLIAQGDEALFGERSGGFGSTSEPSSREDSRLG